MSEDIEVVRRMIDAFNRGDVEGVVATFDESCRVVEPAEMPERRPKGFQGHEGIREWMANLRETVGIEFRPVSFESRDDAALAELATSGIGRGSGVPIEWTTYVLLHLRADRILRVEAFLDRDQAREAAGLEG